LGGENFFFGKKLSEKYFMGTNFRKTHRCVRTGLWSETLFC
jgi:hypothetical protein